MEAIIDSPIMQPLVLSNEVDLHEDWIPNMGESSLDWVISSFHTILH